MTSASDSTEYSTLFTEELKIPGEIVDTLPDGTHAKTRIPQVRTSTREDGEKRHTKDGSVARRPSGAVGPKPTKACDDYTVFHEG